MRSKPLASLLAASVLCLCFAGALVGQAAGEAEKEKLARELMKMTGSDTIGNQLLGALTAQIKQSYPSVPDSVWSEIQQSVTGQEIVDLLIPQYTRNFSAAELQQLIDFYKTPVGKKFIAKLPEITQESLKVGQDWGRKKAEEIIAKLQAKGYSRPTSASPHGQK